MSGAIIEDDEDDVVDSVTVIDSVPEKAKVAIAEEKLVGVAD
jgi:hypothetical protein